MKHKASTLFKLVLLIAVLGFVFVILFDQLFSKPTIHQGVIIEKIEVPRKGTVAGPHITPYGGKKTYNYIITAEKYHQWIALVKSDDNEILKVHCSSDHYYGKEVGDTILFKEYKGDLLKVDYLIHSEEDTLQTDWDKVFHHENLPHPH